MSIGLNSKGFEITSKTSSAVISDQGEWYHYFDVFCETFKNAFPESILDIKAYAKFIMHQGFSNGKRVNWIFVAAHDDALRRTFADQTFLSFSDWNHPETSLLKTQHMGSAFYSKTPFNGPSTFGNTSKFSVPQQKTRSITSLPFQAPLSKGKFPIKSSTNVPIAEQYCH